jgi:GH15 family glucan-1,4-alpha-glucosidase
MDALEQARKGGLAVTEENWEMQVALTNHVCKVWDQPDNGIWETRGPQQHFVYSKVMAWVCFDRAIKGVEAHGLKGPVDTWHEVRDRIHAEVCDKGFDPARNTFRAAYGSDQLDASLLLLAQTGFVEHDDPRFVGTVEAIEKTLMLDGFVMRSSTHDTDDGLLPGEGAFLACSFWLADAYVSIGRHEDATRLFDRLLAIRNDLGLLAEEYDPRESRQQGNFPQAFSHIALINTAFNLTRLEKPQEQRADGTGKAGHKGDAHNVAAPGGIKRPEASSRSR